MHIPDGFLDITVCAVTYAVFLAYTAIAFKKVKGRFSPEVSSLVSVLAAAIFAAQMLNWPLPGGTSLHFVGGALSMILLGPWLGYLPMFLVLLVQCLVFHDGGITALGANVLNMAIIDGLVGYLCYRMATKLPGNEDLKKGVGAFLGGWLGITLAGLFCGLEIGFSPAFPYGIAVTVPVMTGWHAVLGVVEGVITSLVVLYISRKAPHLMLTGGGRS